MGLATSVVVCCLTCSSVAVKVAHHRSSLRIAPEGARRLAMPRTGFTPELERELEQTGSGRTVCPICCEAFGAVGNPDLAVLACVHAYHFSCLEAYALKRPNAHGTPLLCPVCQQVAVAR
jgi:hypothetical protein